jgi:hypothetical protein
MVDLDSLVAKPPSALRVEELIREGEKLVQELRGTHIHIPSIAPYAGGAVPIGTGVSGIVWAIPGQNLQPALPGIIAQKILDLPAADGRDDFERQVVDAYERIAAKNVWTGADPQLREANFLPALAHAIETSDERSRLHIYMDCYHTTLANHLHVPQEHKKDRARETIGTILFSYARAHDAGWLLQDAIKPENVLLKYGHAGGVDDLRWCDPDSIVLLGSGSVGEARARRLTLAGHGASTYSTVTRKQLAGEQCELTFGEDVERAGWLLYTCALGFHERLEHLVRQGRLAIPDDSDAALALLGGLREEYFQSTLPDRFADACGYPELYSVARRMVEGEYSTMFQAALDVQGTLEK